MNCKHFVVRKKRFCRMTVKVGFDYCGEHQPKLDVNEDTAEYNLRIPCPLDNKHTCYASKLNKHLKKCNANIKTIPPYIVYGINAGNEKEQETRQLGNISVPHILEVISKVNALYEELIEKHITTKILHDDLLTNELKNPEYGETALKHLRQTSSLIAHVKSAGLMIPNSCFIEFGAGRGQLSYWMSKALSSVENASILLVERASLRHKFDNKLNKSENCLHRIRADIADLVLDKVEIVAKSKAVVGVTKHLCGEATDLALRCLTNTETTTVTGLVMAFCCHHRCYWSSYIGKQFFKDMNLTRNDFNVICGLVSWATCGSGLSRDNRSKSDAEDDEHKINNVEARTRFDEIGLSRKERELVGQKCKLLIDFGRLYYLQKREFSCNLYYYVEQNITLENEKSEKHELKTNPAVVPQEIESPIFCLSGEETNWKSQESSKNLLKKFFFS